MSRRVGALWVRRGVRCRPAHRVLRFVRMDRQVEYRVILYSFWPRGPGPVDASTPRARGGEASPHNPSEVGPRTPSIAQDETGRRRPGDGNHAGGGESLQYAEPRCGPGDAPALPGD